MKAKWTLSDLGPHLWAFAFLAIFWSGQAAAQTAGSTRGVANAEVVAPIRAVPLADLSFGGISVDQGGAGEVRVDSSGSTVEYLQAARPQCGGVQECAPHPARFAVFGAADQTYAVSLPSQIVAYGRRTGRGLDVSGLEMRSINAPSQSSGGRLDGAGQDTFFVGGILSVPAGNQSDAFTTELPVTVFYN